MTKQIQKELPWGMTQDEINMVRNCIDDIVFDAIAFRAANDGDTLISTRSNLKMSRNNLVKLIRQLVNRRGGKQ